MTQPDGPESMLILRLGAMGDILHALPAVASLKRSFPECRLIWTMAPKWMPLVEGNPSIDEVVPFNRRDARVLMSCWRRLRELRPEWAIDFQGLIQSALVGRAAGPKEMFGFDKAFVREPLAAALYSHRLAPGAAHVVDRNLELAAAAGANILTREAWLPAGSDEDALPQGRFVLTNPVAGWKSKQWPIAHYQVVAKRLLREGVELVANVPRYVIPELSELKEVRLHSSSIPGLIAATRRASAVLGLDSGPLHLAAALHKPGVALFGPTDPARNGPYGRTIQVIRAADAQTTYKRGNEIHPSMKRIRPEQVAEELLRCLASSGSEAKVRQ
jgi:heptosyltransferase I